MRGRKRISDQVQEMKGNPRKRRLQLGQEPAAEGAAIAAPAPEAPRSKVEIPAFLTAKREREIFRRVVDDYVQNRIARSPDLTAYGRWAYYLHRWCKLKEGLEKKRFTYETRSKHGKLLRMHPDFAAMLRIESVLQSLEDRLGLNPVARQNYLRGLSALPAALADLFTHETPAGGVAENQEPGAPAAISENKSPLAFLQQGATKTLPN